MDLEQLLVQEGVAAPPEELRGALAHASAHGLDPVVALVERRVVVEDVLAEVLARASGTVVVDLDRPIDVDAPGVISSALARRLLALPIARPSSGRIRVAFANPLDEGARRAVEEASGLTVQPLVGTVSALRARIEEAYPGRTTRVIAGLRGSASSSSRSEMPAENTRRLVVPASELPSADTAPLHRLEQRATIEQRHEALLLALIEKGLLTRSDYVESLSRLLSRNGEEED